MAISLNWLPQVAFAYILLFARIGTMLMLLPALGEDSLPQRMRLSFALAFCLVVYPLLAPGLPTIPLDLPAALALLFHEIIVGIILGGITRLFVSSAQVAGSIIAFQIGLSSAMAGDMTQQGAQGVVFANFLSLLGVTLIFATDMHHMALAAVYESYSIFAIDAPLMFDDAAQFAIRAVSGSFLVGVQMAAPFIVFGLLFNLGMGILSRLMPALQIYFMAMPANIWAGLALFALLLAMMMGLYLAHFEQQLAVLRG